MQLSYIEQVQQGLSGSIIDATELYNTSPAGAISRNTRNTMSDANELCIV